MKLSGVIFDFDGTLATLKVDFSLMRKEVEKCLTRYNIPIEIMRDRYILEAVEAGFSFLLPRNENLATNFRKEAFYIIEEIEISAARLSGPIPGVPAMLAQLKARGLKTAVITRNCLPAVKTSFPSIHQLVDVVLARDHVKPVKPELSHLTAALTLIGLSPGEAAMVGDHPMDIAMGKRGQLLTVGVLSGSGDRGGLEKAKADYILETAAELTHLLDMLETNP